MRGAASLLWLPTSAGLFHGLSGDGCKINIMAAAIMERLRGGGHRPGRLQFRRGEIDAVAGGGVALAVDSGMLRELIVVGSCLPISACR